MSEKMAVGIVAGMILLKLYLIGSQPPEKVPEPVTPTEASVDRSFRALSVDTGDERIAWAQDFLRRIGNESPTIDTIGLVWAWQGGENTDAQFNPLATTQPMPGDSCFNYLHGKCGVRNYPDYETGIQASVHTLTNGNYPNILAGLQSNNIDQALNSDELGTWGTGLGNVQRKLTEWQATHPGEQIFAVSSTAEVRKALVAQALALQGIPYVSGGRSASGGDCSGTMQFIYKTVTGIDIGATTFSQYPNLEHIDLAQVQPGDLWYGQYYNDQHTGMVADVDGDGKWDLINNGGLASDMHVDYDFMSMDYFNQHTMGFARAIA